MVWTVKTQTEQKRGEELAKRSAASFALVLSLPVSFALPYLTTLRKRTRTRRAGWQTVEALPCCLLAACRWRCGGEVVAMTSPRSGRGGRPSLSLSADTSGRSGERLAMVWTMKVADGTEERRGTGKDLRRHPSPWFHLFLFRLLVLLCPTITT